MPTPPLTNLRTRRLLLRALRSTDAPAIRRLAGDERVSRHTAHVPHPYPEGAAEAFIAESCDEARGDAAIFALTLAAEPGALLGVVTLKALDGDGMELGYWLGFPYWGRGLMSEAVAAVASYGRRWRSGSPISARTFPKNVASRRVLEKAGFKQYGFGICDAPARRRQVEGAPLYVFEPDETHAEATR